MATTSRLRPARGSKPAIHPTARNNTPAPRVHAAGANDGFFGAPPFTIFHFGESGIGKTSMYAHAPEVGFIHDSKEHGILTLSRFKQCPKPKWVYEVDDFLKLRAILADVANQKFGIKLLVLDSATGMELLTFAYHCCEYFDNDWSSKGFYSYFKGPKNAAKTNWPELLDDLDGVRNSGIPVVLIGHSQIKSKDNPDGENYAKYLPYLDNETWAQTHRWAQGVLFHKLHAPTEEKGGKAKAIIGEETRQLYTQPEATIPAKNQWGLPGIIELGTSPKESFEAFKAAYLKASK